jgi:hypothetical protein
MEGIRTIPEVVIPSKPDRFMVRAILFRPQDMKVLVILISIDNPELPEVQIEVDLTDEWAALTTTRKNNWKAMFKTIVTKATGLSANEITGDIWD